MWDTKAMRVYVPALSNELTDEKPVIRPGWAANAPANAHPDEREVYEYTAQTEAALASLEALRESPHGNALVRLVLAVDLPIPMPPEVPDSSENVEVAVSPFAWHDVQALLVDGSDAHTAVRAVIEAKEQDEADTALGELWDHAMEWFDVSERQVLSRALHT
ncbi:MAG: hypothetical protein CSA82_02805 [Actinobacteria bacterium]|nr:MAG: hypothetical protein CSA82_02805 [Actinomycetota bacterium]